MHPPCTTATMALTTAGVARSRALVMGNARRQWTTTTTMSASVLQDIRRHGYMSRIRPRICIRSCDTCARRQTHRRAHRRRLRQQHRQRRLLSPLLPHRRQHRHQHLLRHRPLHQPRTTAMLVLTTAGATRSRAQLMRHARRQQATTTSASVLRGICRHECTSRIRPRICRRS